MRSTREEGAGMFVKCGVLHDGSGGSPRRGAVLEVRDGSIVAIHDRPPSSAEAAVDWGAFTVLPGLIDAHDHLTLDLGDEELQSREPETWTVLKASGTAARIVSAGITTLRDCGARRQLDLQVRT